MTLREFAERHPYEVRDSSTGRVVVRFSNLGAAFNTAKADAGSYPTGLDVIIYGERIGHWSNPALEALESETLS